MKIYITCHGQAINNILTDTGKKQADYLGKELNERGFSGKIYCTPGAGEKTARIIAKYTGSEIIIHKPLKETDNVIKKLDINEDTLFAGDRESSQDLCKSLGIPVKSSMCNCTLCYLEPFKNTKRVYNDTGHLPYDLRGCDFYMQTEEYGQKLKALMEKDTDIPKKKDGQTRIFHISDTSSYFFPYYEKILRETKPDIIIHTGDFVDEVKAGRVKWSREEYNVKVTAVADILKNAGAEKIYAVCGNNDIEDVLKSCLSEAEFVIPGSETYILGIKCILGHSHADIVNEGEWSFYGHGITGESWSPEKNNIKEGICRFNAIWNFSVIDLPERKWYGIEYPEEV